MTRLLVKVTRTVQKTAYSLEDIQVLPWNDQSGTFLKWPIRASLVSSVGDVMNSWKICELINLWSVNIRVKPLSVFFGWCSVIVYRWWCFIIVFSRWSYSTKGRCVLRIATGQVLCIRVAQLCKFFSLSKFLWLAPFCVFLWWCSIWVRFCIFRLGCVCIIFAFTILVLCTGRDVRILVYLAQTTTHHITVKIYFKSKL